MVLGVMRKLGQTGQGLLVAAGLLVCSSGCTSGPEEDRQAAIQRQRLDWMDPQSQASVAKIEQPVTVRSQNPGAAQPANAPAAVPAPKLAAVVPTPIPLQGESQVRVVATIGTTPIYEREVREAVYQFHLFELVNLPAYERTAREQALYKQELHKLIERELVLEELFAMIKLQKSDAMLKQLQDAATKEADQRLRDFQKRAGLQNADDFKMSLQAQGLSAAGVRRSFERSFMMTTYLNERIKPKRNSISLIEVKDYYDTHSEEFVTTDRVKWQDIFVRIDRFKSNEDAKKYATWLRDRGQHGDDFSKLIDEFDMGNCKSLGGFGFGEERGKISPSDLEQLVFSLKQGQVAMIEFEGAGYHIIRIAERSMAGRRPLDENLQGEIRKKLEAAVGDHEYRKIIADLWLRSPPVVAE